jgi:hypothetical protein
MVNMARPAGRHAGSAFPASTSSLMQHGNAAMLKPPRPAIRLLRQ